MALHWARLSKSDEVFSWTDARTGGVIHIAVTRLNAYLGGTGWPLVRVVIDPALAEAVAAQNCIEADHVFAITAERREAPVTMLEMDDGTVLPCDGSHRILRRFIDEVFWVRAFMVPERLWRRFSIEGTPGEEAAWRSYLIGAQTMRRP
jgi:hypothetical protein